MHAVVTLPTVVAVYIMSAQFVAVYVVNAAHGVVAVHIVSPVHGVDGVHVVITDVGVVHADGGVHVVTQCGHAL